jgi:hypothetical protein
MLDSVMRGVFSESVKRRAAMRITSLPSILGHILTITVLAVSLCPAAENPLERIVW